MSEKNQSNTPTEPDWKSIATELARGVTFAIQYMKPSSPGAGILDTETRKITPYREFLAQILENYPGMTVDREMMALTDLPKAKRKKAVQELQAKRAATKAAKGE